ncbi:MAG TPA: Zn-dependent hydrolase [Candidatus Bathyarchaeia archaeon]|nr:Zn-dependent hydrolase [Candidatus Bathyarchaeia archaeon]
MPEVTSGLRVSGKRLEETINTLSKIGMTTKGSERTAYTVKEIRAKGVLTHLMKRIGLQVSIDGVGNVFGKTRQGGGAVVMIGSHIDTVPGGGRFDGVVGVAAGIEVARIICENNIPLHHPIEICAFSAEESSRFGVGTIGSAVVAGELDARSIDGLQDKHGVKLGEVLARFGRNHDAINSAKRKPSDFHAYLELHIEQGPILENEGKKIGVVSAISASTRLSVKFLGRADHSGTTPMNLRRDALTAASELILAVEQICKAEAGEVVGTVGSIKVSPNAMNVVPGTVELGIDIRSVHANSKKRVTDLVVNEARKISSRRDVQLETAIIKEDEPVILNAEIVSLLENVCKSTRVPYMRMISGAGHDAMKMARLTKCGVIFVPSKRGLSHNPREWTDMKDIETGANCLLDATLRLAA